MDLRHRTVFKENEDKEMKGVRIVKRNMEGNYERVIVLQDSRA